jgi:hypothetical protein
VLRTICSFVGNCVLYHNAKVLLDLKYMLQKVIIVTLDKCSTRSLIVLPNGNTFRV